MGDKDILVTNETTVYAVGEGFLADDTFVIKASLYVGGVLENGKRRATFVIVQPSEAQASSPRSAAGARDWTPSSSDPTVGELGPDIAQ